MSEDPVPSFEVTYRRADGEHIDDYGWVTDLEFFQDDEYPIELVEERWVRTGVRKFWRFPEHLGSCEWVGEEFGEIEDCDEDAAAWEQQPDGEWAQMCQEHLGRKNDG